MTPEVETALAAMDRALRDRPSLVYDDLTEAVRCLVRLRDGLIAARRGGDTAAGDRLEGLNALFSLVVAAEYPLEGVRRSRIENARRALTVLFG
ncbi:MAG TPA: hypothetical protein VGN21_12190 [Stellaceae bacterium]|jgi:hypothetical protein